MEPSLALDLPPPFSIARPIEAHMSQLRKILIVASARLRAGLVEQLAAYPEFELIEGETLESSLLQRIAIDAPDLLLADARCGSAEAARAAGFCGPVLLLCDKTSGARPKLPVGPAEYVGRPFRFADLLARIRANLRPRETAHGYCLAVGAYRFRPGAGELLHEAGARLRLTEKETAILSRLALAGGEAVSKDILLREVWGYAPAVTTRTLETHIYRLRRKIESDPCEARLLVTEKKGYRLVSRDRPSSEV